MGEPKGEDFLGKQDEISKRREGEGEKRPPGNTELDYLKRVCSSPGFPIIDLNERRCLQALVASIPPKKRETKAMGKRERERGETKGEQTFKNNFLYRRSRDQPGRTKRKATRAIPSRARRVRGRPSTGFAPRKTRPRAFRRPRVRPINQIGQILRLKLLPTRCRSVIAPIKRRFT